MQHEVVGASAPSARALDGVRSRVNAAGMLFVAPAVFYFIVFLLLPTLAALALAFTHWDGYSFGSITWAGVSNFIMLFPLVTPEIVMGVSLLLVCRSI